MNKIFLVLVVFVGFPATMVSAAEVVGQQRIINRTYVSPGASGSISESSRQQGYTGYGGYQVPDNRYGNSSNYQGNGSTQIRGNVRQTIEYPGVGEFERQPGSRSVQKNRP